MTSVRDVPGPPGAPALVLLHGWTATADVNFRHLYGPLAQRWRLVAFDHRGHGRGLRCEGPFRLEDCADDAVAVLDALGIDEAVVLGYSMGGPVALLASARHPGRIRGLVLCATSGVFVDGLWESALYRVVLAASAASRAVPPPVVEHLAARLCANKAQGHSSPAWLFDETARHHWPTVLEAGCALGRFRADQCLTRLDVPAAVVAMLNDEVVPVARQLELARRIPGCTLHTLAAGHAVCLIAPDELVPVVTDACESVRRRLVLTRPAGGQVA
ncbi:MAG: alpha/beta hydrolase [Actinomycetota bacterium]|jgi:3-oxoadipate enol-lactonase